MDVGWKSAIWIFTILVGLALLCGPGVGWAGEQRSLLHKIEEERATILEDNRSSVVRIHAFYAHSGEEAGFGAGFMHGTGFVFDPRGYILTVEEAVRGAEEIRVTLASGLQTRATFVASDPASEVAVIRVEADSLPAATLGSSGRVRIGHYAFILGNTFGNLTPSFGSVYEVNRDGGLIHIMAPVHSGYGGAPVFSSTGEVVGIAWTFLNPWAALRKSGRQDGDSEVISGWQEFPATVFVIPINRAVRIARRLIAEQEVVYGWLGVEGEYDPEQGVRVINVSAGGPAAASGIRPGDLILSYQGKPILSGEHLKSLVAATSPGAPVQMQIRRGVTSMTARVEVGRMSAEVLMENDVFDFFSPPSLPSDRSQEALFQKIDRLQQELWQLRQQVLQSR